MVSLFPKFQTNIMISSDVIYIFTNDYVNVYGQGPQLFDEATNVKWGMPAIQAFREVGKIVCVNAMWQSSRAGEIGRRARDRTSWSAGSLVRVLTDELLRRCDAVDCDAMDCAAPIFICSAVFWNNLSERGFQYLTLTERVDLTMVSKWWGTERPLFLVVRKTLALMRRLVFAKISGEIMRRAGLKLELQYAIAGFSMNVLQTLSLTKMVQTMDCSSQRSVAVSLQPLIFNMPKATALAVLLVGAAHALDYDAERALRIVIEGLHGNQMMKEIDNVVKAIFLWSC